MKKMRKFIPAVAMLLVSAVMLTTASYAWFTMSTTATATGMTVSAQANSSLLIVNANDTTNTTLTKFQNSNGVATFTDKGQNLLPATHFDASVHKGEVGQDGSQAELTAPTSGLVYITNTAEVIDPSTGLVKDTAKAVYAGAGDGYYKDYVVYLGTAGGVMPGTLKATVTANAAEMGVLQNAIAIDFLVATSTVDEDGMRSESAAEFKGTTWLEVAKESTGSEVSLGTQSIPEAVTTDENNQVSLANYLVVTMRVYFDGAYAVDSTDGAYVRDVNINTNELGFNVVFDLVK